ncbi:hypothetical protein ACFWY5_25510 [Nonomuraea sp. NPDC059007]|uniref:hypothetical protein n=1 Tax=Nonomuraea sp. NPDC059007 TaxID=3346692 RepID=UPI0036AF38D3
MKSLLKSVPLWLTVAAALQMLACRHNIPPLSVGAALCVLGAGIVAAKYRAASGVRDNAGGAYVLAGAITLWAGCALHIPPTISTLLAFTLFGVGAGVSLKSSREHHLGGEP